MRCGDLSHRMMMTINKMTCAPSRGRLRSDWASAQSDQSLRCPHEEDGSLAILGAHSEDYDHAQADLSLCWAHMSFCWFCRVAAHFSWSMNLQFSVNHHAHAVFHFLHANLHYFCCSKEHFRYRMIPTTSFGHLI